MHPLAIGDRRELFLDGALVDTLDRAAYQVHQPERREIALRFDAPHEDTNLSGYQTIVKTPDRYLMYYRAGVYGPTPDRPEPDTTGRWRLCVAESPDGKTWTRPRVNASPEGENVVLDTTMTAQVEPDPVCPAVTTVFYDTNPAAPESERFKMLVTAEVAPPRAGIYLFVSPDGLHFTCKSREKLALDNPPDTWYDSQNLAFFDHGIGEYRLYHRTRQRALRSIRGQRSPDFATWTATGTLALDGARDMQLYTNQIQPYYRAPHLLIGTPMRYNDNGMVWDEGIYARPGLADRVFRAARPGGPWDQIREGTASTDTVVIASRDGEHFRCHGEAFVRPGDQTRGNWAYGDNFLASGYCQTASDLGPDFPDEISFYRVENYKAAGFTAMRRMALRLDGFVSIRANADPGDMTTRPFTFAGGRLTLNIATSAYGFIACEFQDADGRAIPGYTLRDAIPVSCNGADVTMRWGAGVGPDVRPFAGKPVRLRFRMRDADLYAMRFTPFRADPPLPAPGDSIDPARYADV